MSDAGLIQWLVDRARQATQHPADHLLRMSRGDHYRRMNTGVALRTFRDAKAVRW